MSRFKWTIEIEVDESWVADGFDATDERVQAMLASDLTFAYSHELGAKVIARPPDEEVAKVQGYKTVKEYLRDRRAK